jgi:predicted  nucleic acid-binding Zn-ribbon protein
MGSRHRHATRLHPTPLALLAALAGAVALAIPGASSGAGDIDALNSQIADAKQQAEALGAQVQQTSEQLAAAQSEAIAAARREAQLSAVLAEGQERERQLEAAVAEAKQQLAIARDQLQHALGALSQRLVDIYRDDMPDTMALLLDSDGFDDLATRAEYLTRIEEADAALVHNVRTTRDAVRIRLGEVSEAQARAHAFNVRIATARDQIAAVRANAEARAAELASLRAQRQAQVETLQSRVAGWTKRVEHLEAVSASQASEQVGDWLGDYVIPESIVMCESGGNWEAVNPTSGAGGAYQILPSTWDLYGGEGLPQNASPEQQSEIAAQIWADSGSAAWECAG